VVGPAAIEYAGRVVVARRLLLLVLTAAAAPACGTRINLGSDLIWEATHESGDLNEWSQGTGGALADTPDATVEVTTDLAHGGRYAVKLTNGAAGAYKTARLWHQDTLPRQAYYSVWYYLPRAYQTPVDWTILQFRTPTDDPTVVSQFLDVGLRSLPGGDLILTLFDHRPQYLRSPTPDPAQPVPVGRWFQIQVFYRNVNDDSGRFTLWLDGQLNYDIQRPMTGSPAVYFTPCSISEDLSPAPSEIYVDDAAISYDPLTPRAVL
jgi:hypothetical protein